jgi:p90 ribosomal S6 kinase
MMYAMKIVGKKSLLESSPDDASASMISVEVKMLRALRHPFIIGMYYSFQTADAALIVMELAQGGTLQSITRFFKDGLMKESHIRFYIAEIAEALHYLHGLGLVYRDLKPANVVICRDGHVKLADLGGVSDAKSDLQPTDDRDVSGMLNLYTYTGTKFVYDAENLSNPVRSKSVLGTRGYMAPEMLELATCNHRFAIGYSYMADWWSMGVLIYVLLHGSLPFVKKGVKYSVEQEVELLVHGAIDISASLSSECVSFMCSLLEVADTERLGHGAGGIRDIRNHNFMESFDWENVMKKACRPPIISSEEDDDFEAFNSGYSQKAFSTYENLPLPKWTSDNELSAAEQEMFSDWNYISPTTVRIEMGMANAERQYDGNAKIQQLLGEFKSNDSIRSTGTPSRKRSSASLLQAMLSRKHAGSISQGSDADLDAERSILSATSPSSSPKVATHKTISNLPKRTSVLTLLSMRTPVEEEPN